MALAGHRHLFRRGCDANCAAAIVGGRNHHRDSGRRCDLLGDPFRREPGAAVAARADRTRVAAGSAASRVHPLDRTDGASCLVCCRAVHAGEQRNGDSCLSAIHAPETVTAPFSRDRPALAAGVITVLLGGFSAWQVAPSVPAGDEPHYLVITQSLLKDGDLRIENNHRQRDYRAYLEGDIPPDFRVRGRNREIYSIHAPGVSVLVAPAFAAAGYDGVVVFLLILSGITGALAWHLAFLLTGRMDAAWFGWASVAFSATFLFHTFTVYPDGPGALAGTERRVGGSADRA